MREISVLAGGRAGDGIAQAGEALGRVLAALGRRVYILSDYPSLIRGGHNFSIVRGAGAPVFAHREALDFVLALDRETAARHRSMLRDPSRLICDAAASPDGIRLPLGEMLKGEGAPPIMRNACLVGAFGKCAGIAWETVEKGFPPAMRDAELNRKLARKGYDAAPPAAGAAPGGDGGGAPPLPLVAGNEAIGLGLAAAGLDAFVSYPMTPASGLLHFLAAEAGRFGLKVIHPEGEIAAVMMALGFACAGERAAVGTSGGGFCLMTEGMSLAGMAEIPLVIVLGQRAGPSTGIPTYTAQTELDFARAAGHGEFPRLVVAPGTPEEAYFWSAAALNLAWRYQVPAIVLADKTLCEGVSTFDISSAGDAAEEEAPRGGGAGYRRYLDVPGGVSPLAFPPEADAVVKVNSYEHDESGLTTEEPGKVRRMQEKRLRKGAPLAAELGRLPAVTVAGDPRGRTAVLSWGSNTGVCAEAAAGMGLRAVGVSVVSPFPAGSLRRALDGADRVVTVEHSAAGQFAALVSAHGFDPAERIMRCDGRPFSVEEMERALKEAAG